jgi:predicted  nucleic acid-binding Zn-ribbon protein
MKDTLVNRIQELTKETEDLMRRREQLLSALKQADADISNKAAVIIELKKLIESCEQSQSSNQETA